VTRRKKDQYLDDPEVSPETKHKMEYIRKDEDERKSLVVTDEWYEIKERKVLKYKQKSNGTRYCIFVCNNNPKYKEASSINFFSI